MFIRFRHRLLSKHHHLILFSLAIADFAVGVGGILVGQFYYLLSIGDAKLVVYKLGACIPYFGSFFMSISLLSIMTADRLISVRFPVRHLTTMTRRKIVGLIGGAWLLVTMLIVSQVVIFFVANDNGWTELKSRALLFSIFFTVAVLILSMSNAYLFIQVRSTNNSSLALRSNKVGPTCHEGAEPLRRNSTKEEAKSSNICIWLTILFIVCWFPVAIYYQMWSSLGKAPADRGLLTFCLSLASANSLSNPIVYLLQNKYFLDCFRNVFRKNLSRQGSNHNSSAHKVSQSSKRELSSRQYCGPGFLVTNNSDASGCNSKVCDDFRTNNTN